MAHTLNVLLLSCLLSLGKLHAVWSSPPPPSIDSVIPKRFIPAVSLIATGYAGFSYGLYQTWYAPYRTSRFHTYNDWLEWRNMDKAGHLYSAFFQTALLYEGARWTGLGKTKSLVASSGLSLLFLSTIEVMDGYSSGWGFSFPDMGANLLGTALFASQAIWLKHPLLRVKWSSVGWTRTNYTVVGSKGTRYSLSEREENLFGASLPEQLLKNYNATHVWISINPSTLLSKNSRWPKWLSIAVGLGAGNLYGGYKNEWTIDGEQFELSSHSFPRYSSIYLSPDLDWTAIHVRNIWLKRLFMVLNIFKLPAPALEYRTTGDIKWHWLLY